MIEPGEKAPPAPLSDANEIRILKSRRISILCMYFAAMLAVIAMALQLVDGVSGEGSYWRGLISAVMALWWIAMAVFLSRQRPKG
jgi:uncharacterized membrane protein